MLKIYFDSKRSMWLYIMDVIRKHYRVNHKEKYVEIDDRDHDDKELISKAKTFDGYIKFSRK